MEFKPQDLLFLLVLIPLFFKRDPRLFVYVGLFSIILSIPLFAKWIFFTAERLIWYAFLFFLIATILNLVNLRHNKSK
jgi:hypothetical protein